MGGPMGFANILNQKNFTFLKNTQQFIRQSMKPWTCVRKTARVCLLRAASTCLVSIPRCQGSISTNIGLETACRTEAISGRPSQGRDNYVSTLRIAQTQSRHRQLIGRRPRIDKNTVFDTQPDRPFFFKSSNIARLSQIGSSCCRWAITASKSARLMLLRIKGRFRGIRLLAFLIPKEVFKMFMKVVSEKYKLL